MKGRERSIDRKKEEASGTINKVVFKETDVMLKLPN